MKKYLEIKEQLSIGSIKEAKIVKIEVNSKEEAIEKLKEDEKSFKGLNYTKMYHICNHGKTNQPCTVEKL